MADARARREDETIKEWLARLARERHARDQLSSGRSQISDVTQPPVAPLVDIEPTVSEQVEQAAANQPALQGRGFFDANEITADPNRPLPASGSFEDVNVGLPGDTYSNLMRQAFTRTQPSGPSGHGWANYDTDIGWPSDMPANEMYNIVRRGLSEEGKRVPGMLDPEGEEDIPWVKGVASQALGFFPDLVQEIMTSDKALPWVPAGGDLAEKAYEGWTGEKADKGFGKFEDHIRGGSKWWRQAFTKGAEGDTEYEDWFSKATSKQTGWPWGESKDPEEVELKLSITDAVSAGDSKTTGGQGSIPTKRVETPSVMGDSRSRMLTMMLGENPSEAMDMSRMFEKAEGDYNTALMIGQLTGKGVGPANKFMSSFLQGASLQYRMDSDKQRMAYNIMTTKPTAYYWHDANDGIEPQMLFPWDDVPKGYVPTRPQLTGQQRDRKQYSEILNEYPSDREAGLDAAMDMYIANNPQIFSVFETMGGTPEEVMEKKLEYASRVMSGWFNPGKGQHYTRLERQQFAAEWAKAEEEDNWQKIIEIILRKQKGWPMAFDSRVRARFGES